MKLAPLVWITRIILHASCRSKTSCVNVPSAAMFAQAANLSCEFCAQSRRITFPAGIWGGPEQAYRWLTLVKTRYAASIKPMMDIVDLRIAMLAQALPKVRRDSLDSDVASWPSRQFSAVKHPE